MAEDFDLESMVEGDVDLNEFEEVEGCLAGIHEKLFKLKEFITDNPIDADEDILKLKR